MFSGVLEDSNWAKVSNEGYTKWRGGLLYVTEVENHVSGSQVIEIVPADDLFTILLSISF